MVVFFTVSMNSHHGKADVHFFFQHEIRMLKFSEETLTITYFSLK